MPRQLLVLRLGALLVAGLLIYGCDDGEPTQPDDPVCSIAPLTLDFDSVTVGWSAALPLVVRNAGSGQLTATFTLVGEDFSIASGGGSFSLGAADSHVVTIAFAPHAAGVSAGTLMTAAACSPVPLRGFGRGVFAPIPDFTLMDVNPNSATLDQPLALHDFADQGLDLFLFFFLNGQCSTCRIQWRQMSLLVDSLRTAGMTNLGSAAVNAAAAWYYAPFFAPLEIAWPALQDTTVLIGGEPRDAFGHALGCEEGLELLILILDERGTYRLHRKTSAFPGGVYGELDLLLEADRARLMEWIAVAAAAQSGRR